MVQSKINFKDRHHIHFTGIKGVGMTALALCAKDLGIKVTGSDVAEYFVTDETLKKAGIDYYIGFNPENIDKNVDLLVTTGAHGGFNNQEFAYAKQNGIEAVSYAEALADLANNKKIITTVGVGGKTTTASMLATIFNDAKEDPSYVVGVGSINSKDRPGHYSLEGKYFICEGDDYVVSPGIDNRAKFLLLDPEIVIVSNIDHDHPDIYKNIGDTLKTFRKLFTKIPKDGLLVACIDSENVRNSLKDYTGPVKTYGFSEDADYVVSQYELEDKKALFRIKDTDINTSVVLKVPGKYNALNATAAFIASKHAGISQGKIVRGLYKYLGCRRRFEYIGEFAGVEVYDDYAHHPKEISKLIETAREWFSGKRVAVVFQPHTYSRTKVLFNEFVQSLSKADTLAVMEIYASAREDNDGSISSEKLVESIKMKNVNVFYTKGHEKTLEWIKGNVKKGDVLLTVGAGDIFHLHKKLFE
ncbi:UDP-N-acetylmuramate--L-alanine ligase [Candidatus Woesebacteria bacterium]|nr:UDP-N-acetylmuramate--L-alanine ligase [Candidatus Woesebacteria bacterium]